MLKRLNNNKKAFDVPLSLTEVEVLSASQAEEVLLQHWDGKRLYSE